MIPTLEETLRASVDINERRAKKVTTELATVEPEHTALARLDSIPVDEIVRRVEVVRDVRHRVMKDGQHYGVIPGVNKPSLYKPGAEVLGLTFQLDLQLEATDRWDGEHLECKVKCTVYSANTGVRLGSGIGSCSTRESKYAWRKAERKCPSCGAETIIRGKKDYGGGWLCWGKKGGCGAKFKDGDASIEQQQTGRVPNPDIADQYNTVRKMAAKRARIDAVLSVTGASELFTQDVEDMADTPPPVAPPDISPHVTPEDEGRTDYMDDATLMRDMRKLCDQIHELPQDGTAEPHEWREKLGTRANGKGIAALMQLIADQCSPGYRQEFGKVWHKANRRLEKLEAAYDKSHGAKEAFRDPPDFTNEDDAELELGRK